MSRLNPKKDYIVKLLEETIFLETYESKIIRLVELSIKAFNDNNKDVDENLSWKSRLDEELGKHLLIMFQKTKGVAVKQIDINEFKSMWNQYIKTDEYYMQILNYIVNSDDYIYGDRLNYETNSNRNTIRPSNYLGNAMRRWEGFEKNPSSKRIYYSKLMAMAQGLNGIVND